MHATLACQHWLCACSHPHLCWSCSAAWGCRSSSSQTGHRCPDSSASACPGCHGGLLVLLGIYCVGQELGKDVALQRRCQVSRKVGLHAVPVAVKHLHRKAGCLSRHTGREPNDNQQHRQLGLGLPGQAATPCCSSACDGERKPTWELVSKLPVPSWRMMASMRRGSSLMEYLQVEQQAC